MNTNRGYIEYVAQGTEYSFNFQIWEESDIIVEVDGTPVPFTVDLDTQIVELEQEPVGSKVVLRRELPIDRNVDYITNGDLRADTLDYDQIYQTTLILDLAEDNNTKITEDDLKSWIGSQRDIDLSQEKLVTGLTLNNLHKWNYYLARSGGEIYGDVKVPHPSTQESVVNKAYVDAHIVQDNYKGVFDPVKGEPPLQDGIGRNGDYYKADKDGTYDFGSGPQEIKTGNTIFYDGVKGVYQNIATKADVSSVAGKTGAVWLDKNDVGLDQVDNTSDLNKPISTATATALTALDNDVTKAESSIAINTSAIATNTSSIATNTSAIATNTSSIATNTSAIAVNTTNIDKRVLITPELQAHLDAGNPMPDWDGADYTDSGAEGANATAKIYPDGTIIGDTDNGQYIKKPDGSLQCLGVLALEQESTFTHVARFDELLPYVFVDVPAKTVFLETLPTSSASRENTINYISPDLDKIVGSWTTAFGSDISDMWGIKVRWTAIGRWK